MTFNAELKWVFIAGGIYGILTEQSGGIFMSFNIIIWFYVFLVYGSFIAIPAAAFRSKLAKIERKQVSPIIYIIITVISLVLAFFILARISMALMFIALKIPF
ncbi:MAG: hypothetical protein ACTSU9_07915 [Promethearchaeota archaeon]